MLEVHRLVQRRQEPQGDEELQRARQRERALKQALQVLRTSATCPPLATRPFPSSHDPQATDANPRLSTALCCSVMLTSTIMHVPHRAAAARRRRSGSSRARRHAESAKRRLLQLPSGRQRRRSSVCAPKTQLCISDRRSGPGEQPNLGLAFWLTCHLRRVSAVRQMFRLISCTGRAGSAVSVRRARGRRGEHAGRQDGARGAGDRSLGVPARMCVCAGQDAATAHLDLHVAVLHLHTTSKCRWRSIGICL